MIILQGLKLKNQRGDITGLKKEANVQSPRLRSPFPGAGRRKGIIISSVSPVAVAMFTRVCLWSSLWLMASHSCKYDVQEVARLGNTSP